MFSFPLYILNTILLFRSEQLKDFKAMIESENKCSALRQKKERLTEWSSQRQELEESFSSKLEQLSAATTLRFKTNDAALDHKLALVKAEIRKQAEAKQAETTEIARRAALATGEAAKLGQEKVFVPFPFLQSDVGSIFESVFVNPFILTFCLFLNLFFLYLFEILFK